MHRRWCETPVRGNYRSAVLLLVCFPSVLLQWPVLLKSEPVQGWWVTPGVCPCPPGPCPCSQVTRPHGWTCLGLHPCVQQRRCMGAAPPNAPQPLFLRASLLGFGRMSERDIQSLSRWVFVLTLCLTTLWGRLTLASTHHRSHSGRGSNVLATCVALLCSHPGSP